MDEFVIKCLLINSFEIYKDKRKVSDFTFENNEISDVLEELGNSLNLSLYDIKVSKTEIIGSLKNDIYDDNIESLRLELEDILGIFKNVIFEEKKEFRNAVNIFSIINRSLFNKGYCMDVLGYLLFSDIDEYSGEDSYFVCHLLTSFIKKALNNKLCSTIYFGETF